MEGKTIFYDDVIFRGLCEMITLSNGFRFEIVVASGALGFDGLGWFWEWPLRWMGLLRPQDFDAVIAKTVTVVPRNGNLSLWHPWTCVRWLGGDSAVNAVGLTNPGIFLWSTWYRKHRECMMVKLAASVQAENVSEARILAVHLSMLELPFVEVNLSCPNVNDSRDLMVARDVVRCLHDEQSHPLIVKLSYDQSQCESLILALAPYIEAFDVINTVPWERIYSSVQSPIEHYVHGRKGGVSGRLIHDMAVRAVRAVRRLSGVTDCPIIGGGGIFGVEDIHDFRIAGASAFSLGSVFLRYPWRPNRIVKQWQPRDSAKNVRIS